jgi:hypothetical protein
VDRTTEFGEEIISMRHSILLAITFACAACGSSSSNGDPGTPVKMQALTGTIQGQSFTAQSAIAQSDGMGGRLVTINATNLGCTDVPMRADGDRWILVGVSDWTAGTSYQLKLDLSGQPSHTATFVVQQGGTSDNLIVATGRVEVQQTGMNAELGLRANDPRFGSVEGTVAVTECP